MRACVLKDGSEGEGARGLGSGRVGVRIAVGIRVNESYRG